jgi:uncharacterized protein (DUF2062 family)
MINNYLKRVYRRFLKIRGTSREIALGLALGLFIGFSPTMGIQMVVGVFIASLLKWSKIATAIGVQVTNPITAPFIYSLTYSLGAKLTGLTKPLKLSAQMTLESLFSLIQQTPRIFGALTLGGVVIGLPVAILVYFVAYTMLDRYQDKLKAGIQTGTWKIRQKAKQGKTSRKHPPSVIKKSKK